MEVIFTELLRRGDLVEEIIPLKPAGKCDCGVPSYRLFSNNNNIDFAGK